MDRRREQVFVGLFVIVAAALLLATVFALSGAFSHSASSYKAKFPYAGGLEEGAPVRYAGGPKVGHVETLQIDPDNPALIDVTFSVQRGVPVKTDSHVKIGSLSPLGDNHLEIVPGSNHASIAPVGSLLTADSYTDFNALTDKLNAIAPDAQRLLGSLNDRVSELKVTISRVNDLLSDQNRANLAGTLAGANGMISENRASVKSMVKNLDTTSQNIRPLLDDLRKTSDQANVTLTHVDAMIGEDSPEIHESLIQLRNALATLNQVAGRMNQTLDVNSENIDEMLENLRQSTENLNQFTDTIKSRPSSLIRSSSPKERKPGDPQ
jgi:phospholipid/cholesterol/gamma-HCH transport system substrate-binding protein